jgi:LysM repeat protein
LKNRLDALILVLMAIAAGVGGAWYLSGGSWELPFGGGGERYTVQPGDTLYAISLKYGVTVDQLRSWNGLSGDLIEVGQVLSIHGGAPEGSAGGAPVAVSGARLAAPPEGSAKRAPRLTPPTPEPCVPFDKDPGEEGIVMPDGLSHGQVKAALDAVLPEALYCEGAPEGASVDMVFTVTVGCDGVVDAVSASSEVDRAFLDCVTDVIRHADFPAHDMADGMTFTYPVSASF